MGGQLMRLLLPTARWTSRGPVFAQLAYRVLFASGRKGANHGGALRSGSLLTGCIVVLLYVAVGIETALNLGWPDAITSCGLAVVSVSMGGAVLYALAAK